MSFQIIISTMNNKFHNRRLVVSAPYLVINQITKIIDPIVDTHTINIRDVGLSRSRNLALHHSTADICLISDDDLEYLPHIQEKIVNIFELYPDVDIITFKINHPDGSDRKPYRQEPFYHNIRTLMKVSSVEIALRHSVFDDGLQFDEDFGLGAKYPTGEEVIFLTDALKKGKNILYYPLSIVSHPIESSGSNYSTNNNLAQAKGAMLYRIFSWRAYFLCPLFALKHYRKTPYSFLKFLNELMSGLKKYRVEVK